MAFLDNGIGQQDRERNHPRGKERNKDQVGSRFRDQAHRNGQQDHPAGIPADPRLQVDKMEQQPDSQEHPEGPGEDGRQMVADDMVPQMLFHEMIRTKQKHPHDNQAQGGEQPVEPDFIEKVEAFFVQFVRILQMAGQQHPQEAHDAQQEGDPMPAPVPDIGMGSMRMLFLFLAAFGLEGIVQPGRQGSGMHHEFHQQARPDTQGQEDSEQQDRPLREQGQHQEGFISRRRNQHGQQRTETQHLMGIERYRRKPAQTAGNAAQQGRYQHLSRAGCAQAV